ncbi:hypothetical protein ACLOJK_009867 [Asimina triloba]
MGNCMISDVSSQAVRLVTDSGGIMELQGPVPVQDVVGDFPGHGIFRRGSFSSPLPENDRLLNGRSYYLLPVNQKQQRKEQKKLDEALRPSSATESDLLESLTAGPGLEVLPSPGNGVWKVRLLISTDKLAEILAEQGNTQALIEKMRTAASAGGATPKRSNSPSATASCRLPRP